MKEIFGKPFGNAVEDYDIVIIFLTKTTAAQNEVALSYHSVRGLYLLAVVFAAAIVTSDAQISKYCLFY